MFNKAISVAPDNGELYRELAIASCITGDTLNVLINQYN